VTIDQMTRRSAGLLQRWASKCASMPKVMTVLAAPPDGKSPGGPIDVSAAGLVPLTSRLSAFCR
jgi:hypothetical protein